MQPGKYEIVNAYAAGVLLVAIGMAGIGLGLNLLEKIAGGIIVIFGLAITLTYYVSQVDSIRKWGDKPETYR